MFATRFGLERLEAFLRQLEIACHVDDIERHRIRPGRRREARTQNCRHPQAR
jgi:hypothetical protein